MSSLGRLNYYRRATGFRGLAAVVKGKITQTQVLLQMTRPEIRFPFFLRVPSSDVPTFDQVLVRKEYEFPVNRPPRIIVDAGANIGLTSLYFSNKFPESKIIAIEPEGSNFQVLERNVAPYKNILPIRGALWRENTKINLVDPGLGEWGFMTQAGTAEERYGEILHEIQGMTVDTIMKEHGIGHIDILKIDIEGAEREVFEDPSAWIEKVDALIVELHERMKSGCNRSFYRGSEGFDDEWVQGESVYLARRGGCLTRPA